MPTRPRTSGRRRRSNLTTLRVPPAFRVREDMRVRWACHPGWRDVPGPADGSARELLYRRATRHFAARIWSQSAARLASCPSHLTVIVVDPALFATTVPQHIVAGAVVIERVSRPLHARSPHA